MEKLGQDSQLVGERFDEFFSEGSSFGVYVRVSSAWRSDSVTITSGPNETCWMVRSVVVALSPNVMMVVGFFQQFEKFLTQGSS